MNSFAVSRFLIILALAGVLGITYTPTEGGGALTMALRYFLVGFSLLPLLLSPGSYRIHGKLLAGALLLGSYLILVNMGSAVQTLFAVVWIFFASVFFVSVWSTENRLPILVRALDIVIITFVTFLFLQAIYYGLIGVMMDFHNLLFPFSQARLFQTQDSLWRFTGHQIEPGTYANWMYALVLLRALASGALFSRISFIGIASILVTTSFWGFFAVVFFILAYLLRKNKPEVALRKVLLIMVSISVGMVLIRLLGIDVASYVSRRLALSDFSSSEKIAAFSSVGKDWANYVLVGKPLNYDFCGGCASRQDSGILLNLFVHFGGAIVVAFLVVIAIGARKRFGYVGLLVLVPFFFGKYSIGDFPFWVVVAFLAAAFLSKNRAWASGRRLA